MKLPSKLMRPRGPATAARTIFLSKKMLPVSMEEQVNVVLSPAFYWFREVVLPAKNAVQAKKLVPSYFDAILPEGEYEYAAIAQADTFWLFAYDPGLIAESLDDAGIRPSQVRALYFAQTECSDMQEPCRINDDAVLLSSEGTVSVVRSRYVTAEETIEAYLARSPRSRHKVAISLYRSGWLDEKQIARLTTLAIAFLVLYLGNFLQLRYQYKQQLVREYAMKEHYKMPETSFQLKSLINSLEGKQRRQMRLRTVFKHLTQMPLQDGEALASLSLDEKKADLQIILQEAKRAEAIKAFLEKSVKVVSSKVKDNIYYASIAYE